MMDASLVVVGSGIKFLSHLTNEARVYIENSQKVLYLINDPAMEQWIQKKNSRTESLVPLYYRYHKRQESYEAISHYILNELRKMQHVCVVFYGHPSVFCDPGLAAVKQARKEGFFAKLLPGISADACLFADLLIDPSDSGCHFFEATDFLIYQRQFDPTSHLILWQIDVIGLVTHELKNNKKGIIMLCKHLLKFYTPEHEIIIYEAAQYPTFEPVIQKILLKNLPEMLFSPTSSLYIPPKQKSQINNLIYEELLNSTN